MRRSNATRAGLPAVAFSLLLAGCGGSGGGEETPVVDLSAPGSAGPPGAAPAPAAPPAPADPVPGAPTGFAPEADQASGDPTSGSPVAASSPAAPAASSPAGGAAASAVADTSGDLALNEMLAAVNAANDPAAPRGRSQWIGGPQDAEGSTADSGAMPGFDAAGGTPYDPGYGEPAPGMADAGAPGGEFLPGGYDAMPGQPGAGGPAEPGNFETPPKAVESFLSALEARDLESLVEATALRAPQQAETEARRRTFQAIRERSLTPEELEAIAADFDGFKIAQMAPRTSGGLVRFILMKQGEYGSTLRRTVDVRRERAGWKVQDVSGVAEMKQIGGRAMQQRYKRDQGGDDGGVSGQP